MTRPSAALARANHYTRAIPADDLFVPVRAGFRLESGEALPDAYVRTRLAGAVGAPVVVCAGGISASRFVCAADRGWWAELVAPGAAVDLDRFQVLAFEYGPVRDAEIAVTTTDQARLALIALDALGIERLHGWIGASYGGMVGLAFAALAPHRLERLCAISAPHRPSAMAVAWRGIQRRIYELARDAGRPGDGLALARELAMTTYRTPEELAGRFGAGFNADGSSRVGRYLEARGEDYRRVVAPGRWWSLCASLDHHKVNPARVTVPTTLVASASDRLVPLADIRELARRLPAIGALAELPSPFGHDAFLKEAARLTPILSAFLNEPAR